MGLFSRGDKGADAEKKPASADQGVHPVAGKTIHCRVCNGDRTLTRCWRRTAIMRACPCCGLVFENAKALYAGFAPACPKCAEPLEQTGFDYGFCDGCGSKYEVVEGTKPGLLPNLRQRQAMDQVGKAWMKK
jgi:hypothetical protein